MSKVHGSQKEAAILQATIRRGEDQELGEGRWGRMERCQVSESPDLGRVLAQLLFSSAPSPAAGLRYSSTIIYT